MAKYLMIESRDPFENADTRQSFELAAAFAKEGHDVSLYLVQNGVLAARGKANALGTLSGNGKVKVLADDYSLSERGIGNSEIARDVTVSNMDALVDLLCEKGTRAIWH